MIESEKQIIGSVLMDNDCLCKIYNKLTPEMFINPFYREAYQEMLIMYDLGMQIDSVELSNRLETKQYGKQDILTWIGDCVISTETSAIITSCAKELINEHKAKKVKNLLGSASLLPKDIENTIGCLITELESLKENRNTSCKSMKEIVKENHGNYFCEREDIGVKTGFYKLDDMLGCLEPGDITVIGARPGVGKSALVTQIIGNVAEQGKRVGYFNLEMNENQVYERFVARLSKMSLTRIRRAKSFIGDEEDKFNRANDKLEMYDVFISTGSKNVSEIKSISRHQNFDLIVIDYLQLVKSIKRYSNRSSEVGDISKEIKALAMELGVHIIVLSQLNRTSEHREEKEPTIAELRESGDIEQDASNIVLVWNLSKKNNKAKGLNVGKQRQGKTGRIGYEFIGENMEFTERKEDFKEYEQLIKDLDKNIGAFVPCEEKAPWD